MSRGTQMMRIALLVVSAAAPPHTMGAQPALVEQPRPFGYVIGDVVTQRVLLTTQHQEFEPTALPPVQRVNIWLERRAPRIEKASDGRRWLIVDYQLINAPQALTTIQLPAWQIEDKTHGTQLAISAATISAAPLISNSPSDIGELRPDREVSIVDTAPTRSHTLLWSIA